MKHAVVEKGIVENIVEGAIEGGIPVEEGVFCIIGAEYRDGVFVVPSITATNYTTVSRRQGLLALFREEGIKDSDIQNIINLIPDASRRYEAQIEFNNQYWELDNPLIASFGVALQITPARMQELFNIANTL